MFGLIKRFDCKKCGNTTIKQISITEIYNVNNNKEMYIPIACSDCGEIHYVSENNDSENNLIHSSEVASLERAGISFY